MKRRNFIQKSALSASALTLGSSVVYAATKQQKIVKPTFNLKYAPHIGMFENSAGKDPIDQLNFIADQGFTAFEDNTMRKRDVALQEKMAKTMQKRGLEMGVFVAVFLKEGNVASGDKNAQEAFIKYCKESVEVAKRVNAKWMTVVPGNTAKKVKEGYQEANVVETLKRASAIFEPHNLTMVLEPLNFFNHPGAFLTDSPQAYNICKAVDSPSCKILFDIYHQQIQEGNLIPNMEACWDEIAYLQIGDNPGRNEPTTGEINYTNVLKFINDKEYTGILGMEHRNSKPGKEGEKAVIEAYKKVDSFK
ncbi:hydroxypyruvate isomerase family protein [Cellulophaga omnivescoria]|uniref:hydroxypyruvate isomerase family protein n=1 Tax=Cellulophaga omnivescoria TaxID=1888890 RepID=UPI0022F0931A|nr:TIM barrel protein [Cellulophaga omnivescoria]WBU89749.1 TIM barrel protein [Cellulophaga omnivescoria]